MDVWYLDDATAVTTLEACLPWLHAYDAHTARQGGKRNIKKTVVTLMVPPEDRPALEQHEWMHGLRTAATVIYPEDKGKTLGITLGGRKKREEAFLERARTVQTLHDRMRRIERTAAELVLAKVSAGVGRIVHMLRAYGDELADSPNGVLEEYDSIMRGTVDRLVPGLDRDGHEQASLAISVGGLGARQAKDTARAACVASRAVADAKVTSLDVALTKAGLIREGQLSNEHRRALQEDVTKLQNEIGEEVRSQVETLCKSAREEAEIEWRTRGEGKQAPKVVTRRVYWEPIRDSDQRYQEYLQNNMPQADQAAPLANPTAMEEESPQNGNTTGRLQRQLGLLVDNTKLRELTKERMKGMIE